LNSNVVAQRVFGEEQRRLALLIDADSAQALVIEGLLGEIAKFSVACVKRVCGDWTSTKHSQWKQALLEHSISPIQQSSYTNGKNATDSSMNIDAMDLMYSQRLDGFCLVSSDGDFTRLTQRLREAGLLVCGFGEQKTRKPFVVACDKFIFTEALRKGQPAGPGAAAAAKSASTGTQTPKTASVADADATQPQTARVRAPDVRPPGHDDRACLDGCRRAHERLARRAYSSIARRRAQRPRPPAKSSYGRNHLADFMP